ncbi:MAG: hypothetical protein ACKN9U_13835, partial [Pirellulaceae bacterium]
IVGNFVAFSKANRSPKGSDIAPSAAPDQPTCHVAGTTIPLSPSPILVRSSDHPSTGQKN